MNSRSTRNRAIDNGIISVMIALLMLVSLSVSAVAFQYSAQINGTNTVTDSYLEQQNANNNHGAETSFVIGRAGNVGRRDRGIIFFNISSVIPSGVRIDNATARIFFQLNTDASATTYTYAFHKVQQSPARAWDQAAVTWNNYVASLTWTTGGGDFAAGPDSISATFGNAALRTWISWNVTKDVQGFLDTPSTNFGWIINSTAETANNNRRAFTSSHNTTTAGYQPQLRINYTDISPPAVSNVTPGGTLLNANPVRIRVDVTDNIRVANVTANITRPSGAVDFVNFVLISAGTYEYNYTFVAQGLHTIVIIANDTSGLINYTGTGNFTADSLAPAMTLLVPSNNTLASRTWHNFSWIATDNINGTLACNLTIDSVVSPPGGIGSVNNTVSNLTVNALADGAHYWNVSCYDGINWNTSQTNKFTVDTTPPAVTNATPQNGQYRNNTVVPIRCNATDNIALDKAYANVTRPDGSVVRVALVNVMQTSYEYNYTPTQVGIHNVTFVANDTSGLVNASVTGWFNVTGGVKLTVVFPLAGAVVRINDAPFLNVSIDSDVVITGVFANITKPDRTNLIVYLSQAGGNWIASYADITLTGRYNITYVMNDDGDDRTTAATWFARQPIDIVDVLDGSGNTLNFTRAVQNNRTGLIDLLVNLSGPVKSVLLHNFTQASGRSILRVRSGSNEWAGLLQNAYGVDLSDMNATHADVRVNAVGNVLWKCAGYNITTGICDDQQNYTVLRENLVPGADYVIALFPGDPGFGETVTGTDNMTDSYLRQQGPNTNYGAATQIIVGTSNQLSRRNRGILWFNISKIMPYAGIRIDNATIELYYEQNVDGAAGSITHNIHRVQQSPARNWNESAVTWNNWNSTGTWTVAGGDFASAATASAITTTTTGVWIKFNVTADAQNFVDTSSTNFGWLINSTLEATISTRRAYSSSESATAAQRPRLVINWTDISPPNVTNVVPQGITYNQTANITLRANVTDNIRVDKVFANVTMPNGSVALVAFVNVSPSAWQGNFSQTSAAGVYYIRMLANDTSGLLNYTETGNFTINGTAAPPAGIVNITGISATPDQQGYGVAVRIRANVSNASAVWVGITRPGSVEINYTMASVNGIRYEYNFTGWLNGTYPYTVYANGTSGAIVRNSSNFTLRQEMLIQVNTMQDQYSANQPILLSDPPGESRMIRSATIEPNKVRPGERTIITVHAAAPSGVRSVVAQMPHEVGIDIVPLALVSGTEDDGIWQADWQAHDTISKDYVATITAEGNNGMTEESSVPWSDPPSIWLIPTSVEQQGTVWTNISNARDGDTDTYASDTRSLVGYSEFIIFNISQVNSDRVRLWMDYGIHITNIDVDINREGVWQDAYLGAAPNLDWMQVNFTEGNITAGRFRYNYNTAGWRYWLYEFQIYNLTSQINLPIVATQAATSIEQVSAVLHSQVGTDGGTDSSIRFIYGQTTAYSDSTPWEGYKYTDDRHAWRITGLQNGITYHYLAQIENSAGRTNGSDLTFVTGTPGPGWVSPTSYSDPLRRWVDGQHAFDDELSTEANCYHEVNDANGTWSSYLYLNRTPSMLVDKIRFQAKANNANNASVDVLINSSVWQTVYTGAFPDKSWVVATFNASNVTQARIRINAANNGEGFNFQVYEFDFYQIITTPPEEQTKMENLANLGGTDASCYVSLRTQYWNGSKWLDDDLVVNDTTPRVLAPQDILKLDTVWNPYNYSTANLSYGDGLYRVYGACTDGLGNVLMNRNGTWVNASSNFTLDATPPSVRIINPVNGTSYPLGSSVLIQVNITDRSNISSVVANVTSPVGIEEVMLIRNVTTGLWEYPYSNTNYVGPLVTRVIATDVSGNVNNTQTVTVNIIDTTPPVVTLSYPPNGYTNGNASRQNISFRCNATDNYDVRNISLYITNNANASFAINRTVVVAGVNTFAIFNLTLASGIYSWNCLAYDSQGGFFAWAPSNWSLILQNVSNQPPTPNNITIPSNGSTQQGLINVTWLNFTDPNGDYVVYNLTLHHTNGSLYQILNTSTNKTMQPWNTSTVPNGQYLMVVTACDIYNACSNTTVTFTVNNYVFIPVLSFTLTLPGQGAVIANSSQNGTTSTMFFNSTSNTFSNMNPCVQGTSFCQNSSMPFFSYLNTGTLNLTMSIFLESALPAVFSLKANVTNAAANASVVTTSPMLIARNMTPSSTQSLWFFGDFINAFPSDNTIRNLTSEGTG